MDYIMEENENKLGWAKDLSKINPHYETSDFGHTNTLGLDT